MTREKVCEKAVLEFRGKLISLLLLRVRISRTESHRSTSGRTLLRQIVDALALGSPGMFADRAMTGKTAWNSHGSTTPTPHGYWAYHAGLMTWTAICPSDREVTAGGEGIVEVTQAARVAE